LSGLLSIDNANALGASSAATSVSSGAELDLIAGMTLAEPLSLAGTGINGSPPGGGGPNESPTGGIHPTGNTTLSADGATILDISGVIGDGAGSFALTKDGLGPITLSGNNTFDGGTTISAGTLKTNNAGALGTGSVTVPAGTLLDILNTGT